MTFQDAKNFVLPFGKHKGKALDTIAGSDGGLKYLDWLRGQDLYGDVAEAIGAYLDDPSIKREIEKLLDDDFCGYDRD